jgi:hypothetical protein
MEIKNNRLSVFAPKERYEQQLEDIRWKFKAENIRIRDSYKCRLCGATNGQFDVHHIRYISGREAWDYDDGDLVTLCHKCHEEIHDWQDFEKLVEGGYYYDKALEGVGVVERKQSNGIWFHACWTEIDQNEGEDHGRLFYEDFSYRSQVRQARADEIEDFWDKVEKYYGIKSIIYDFGKHLKNLLPEYHPIRIKARNRYKEALKTYEEHWSFIKNTYNFTLLISDEYFALLENNRIPTCPYGYGWPPDELPQHYFNIAPVKDVKGKPKENNLRRIKFEELDFSKYRAATTDELQEWLEYEDHLADLREELYGDDLPF